MLRDDPVEVLLFLVLSPAFGSSLPVVDGGRHGLLARNRQFVDLAHRDRVGREDRHVVVEEHLVGHLREVPVADHCPRFRLRQSLCGPPSRSGSVPKVHHVAGDEAIRFICGLQRVERELLDDFHAREPLIRGHVPEVGVIEPPQLFQRLHFPL